jgi:phosphoserine phosphatase
VTLNWSATWDSIRLVAFDVDGTLYRQSSLRLRMARDMLLYAVLKRDYKLMRLLRTYRRVREQLANEEVNGFMTTLLAETVAATGMVPVTGEAEAGSAGEQPAEE